MAEYVKISRISKEKADLALHFNENNIRWYESTHQVTVEVDMKTLSDKRYTLRLYIPRDYPHSCPTLAVVIPARLQQANGRGLPSNKPEFHTLETHDGFQTILHYHEDWHPDYFIYQIFKKGLIWVKSYEEHLNSAKDIDHHVRIYTQAGEVTCGETYCEIWSETQVRRLAKEKRMLDEFFHPNQVNWTHNRRAVDVRVKSHLQNNEYTLRVYFPFDFPNGCPDLAVVTERELYKVNGEPLPANSKEFATLGKTKEGRFTCLKICHFGPTQWMDYYNITSIIKNKGQTWVNAYEHYLLEKEKSFEDCLLRFTQETGAGCTKPV